MLGSGFMYRTLRLSQPRTESELSVHQNSQSYLLKFLTIRSGHPISLRRSAAYPFVDNKCISRSRRTRIASLFQFPMSELTVPG